MTIDVLVVGAGPVGLTLAHELLRRGISCRVIDRAAGPSERSRALVLHCRTQELLEEAGLRERFASQAIEVHGMRFARGQRALGTIPYNLGRYPALSLPQQQTEATLRSALAERGLVVEWGVELTGFAERDEHVEARVSCGAITASCVAGCDGAHSTVRRLLNMPFDGKSLPETVWMADVIIDLGIEPAYVWQFLHPEGAMTAVPMPGRRWRLVAMRASGDGEPGKSFFEAAVRRCTGRSIEIEDVLWVSAFQVNCRLAGAYGRGRVLIAGDAAHIHSPIGGQGMNVGMQDAFDLATRLASTHGEAGSSMPLLEYEHARRPVAAAVIDANARVTQLAMARHPLQRAVRDHVLPNLLRLRPVARRAGLQVSGLQAR